jgi:hypothetical protein
MKQWHPLFARLLRPVVESHYDVQTTVPVGDAPREADLVLLRRIGTGALPFRGLWRHLTTWNILEFKGPAEAARLRHLDLLVELGLGIDRRLNEERTRQRLPALERPEMSFWYLPNRLGRRFLRHCRPLLGPLETLGQGIWRGVALQRPVYLVSRIELPVEEDSLPLHLVGQEPAATELEVARLVAADPALWERYGPFVLTLHPRAWEEVKDMARTKKEAFGFDFRPAVKHLGLDFLLKQIGVKNLVQEIGVENILANLTPAQRRELKRLLQEDAPSGK